MALVPNQSYANADTPLFALASTVTALTPTQWLPAPVTLGPLIPSTPAYVTSPPSYFTTAGKYYDITILSRVDLDSGSTTGVDQMRVIVSVDNAPFNTTLGSFANDARIGGTIQTFLITSVRLLCTVSGVLQVGYEFTQIGGSTADYEVGIASVLVNEVPS